MLGGFCMPKAKYKRILLKLSGEAMAGANGFGIDADMLGNICDYVKKIVDMGVEVAVVVGGGNFWRGRNHDNMDRCTADHIGMLATTMNALALNDALLQVGVDSRVQTSIEMKQIAELYLTTDYKGIVVTDHMNSSAFNNENLITAISRAI